MRAVKNQWFPLLLCTIFLLGSQLSLALNFSSLVHFKPTISARNEISPLQNDRVLDVTTSCTTMYCTVPDSSIQGSDLVFVTSFEPSSQITIKIQVGQPSAVLQISLWSTNLVPIKTTFALSPRDSSQDVSIPSLDGAAWQKSLSFGSSAFSSRQLIIEIENEGLQSTTSTLTIAVDDSTSSSIGGAVGGAIGGVVVIVIIVICIRRRRMRRLMRRRHAQASYQAQNIQQQPGQPGQPGQYQLHAQLQGSIIYQPLPPNSPNASMQQPANIQYIQVVADPNLQFQQNIQYIPVADPNYQQQPNIQYVPVVNYPQPDYQGQGIQLAPPVQMVMPVNPEEGPLSEMNFSHRFPEAPFQNFSSSFPQKTCSICLEDLKIDQNCRQLYCEHIFHGECAKDWLLNQMVKQNHGYCPNCNKNMTFVMERAKP